MASNVVTAEEKPEEATPPVTDNEMVYSTFSKTSKRWIAVAAYFSAMFSGLSSFIYYPAVTPIAEDLHTSIELVNLTITTYLIVSGLAPSIIGDLADRTGRRPLYIATFAIFLRQTLGLRCRIPTLHSSHYGCFRALGARVSSPYRISVKMLIASSKAPLLWHTES
ncbi:MAG: hypothetical protein LQ339_003622 [Xanthoria mediterranea]|nr:MAG: hypothetical protein LQ339_003622 [Xanthoria mediterranea]